MWESEEAFEKTSKFSNGSAKAFGRKNVTMRIKFVQVFYILKLKDSIIVLSGLVKKKILYK